MRIFGDGDIGVPLSQGCEQIPEPVCGALQIIVDEDDIIAVGIVASADQGIVAPAVLGQVDRQDLGILLRLFPDHCQKIVRRTVIDSNDLISKIRPLCDDLTYFIDDEPNGPLTVVTRDDKADQLPPALMYGINIHVNPVPELFARQNR